jgi:phosphate-selective porin OprO and OprP
MGARRNATNSNFRRTTLVAALAAALALGFASAPARADAIDNLLEKLKAKGVLSEEEYNEFKEAREGEKAVGRQRRKEDNERTSKEEERAKTEMVGKFSDGIRWESADKKNAISLNGRIQLDYRDYGGDDALLANTFDIRRAYLTVAGKFWDYYDFDLTADFAGLSGSQQTANACTAINGTTNTCTGTAGVIRNLRTTSHLDVAWLNVGWWKPANLRFGQFKMPMSVEELTSSRFIDFQERSILNQYVPAKERGIMVHGAPIDGLFYGVAVSTGQGKNNNETSELADGTDVIGRVGTNIAQLVGHPNNVYHLAAAYSTGELNPSGGSAGAPAVVPSARTEGRGITFFTPTAFDGQDVTRERTGLEASAAFGPVKVQAEYLTSTYSGRSAAGVTFDRNVDVWYASVNWLITGETYASAYRNGAYGRIRPTNNFAPGGGGWGAWELGLRYTNFDASDFKATNPVGTGRFSGTDKATATTIGLKWLPTPNTRFMLNYVETKFDDNIVVNGVTLDKEKAAMFRAQFDF